MFNQINTKEILKRWQPLLEAESEKKLDRKRAVSTAIMLENQEAWLKEAGVSWGGNNMGGQTDGSTFTNDGVFFNIAVPLVRRTFPELLAHDVVGVQPMTGPAGVAFALRYRAGQQYTVTDSGKDSGIAVGTAYAAGNAELGYNAIDRNYSGSYSTSAGEALGSQAGSGVTSDVGLGIGDGTHVKEVGLTMEKAIVEAVTRKLRARWSMELQQDLKQMHGIEIESAMMDIMSYEVTAEIDRELIASIRSCATSGSWDFDQKTALSGRWEQEKYRSMYSKVLREAAKIARLTRRGSGNFIIASPNVCAAFEALESFTIAPVNGNKVDNLQTGVAKVGVLGGRFMLYRDTFAEQDEFIVGYKGASEFDTGIVYLPYVQLQMAKATFEDSLQPTMGLMSRYAIHSNIFGCSNFYSLVKILNLPA